MDINVGSELYTGNKSLPNFGLKIGETGPEGRYLSNARSGTEKSRKAKINGVASFLHRLLHEGAVNALLSKDRLAAYVEYRKTSTGELYQGYYDDDTRMIFWKGAEPHLFDKLLPFIVFALHESSPFPETRNTFRQLISNYIISGSADVGEIYHLCDDFYYEMKKYYGSLQLEVDTTFDIETHRHKAGDAAFHLDFKQHLRLGKATLRAGVHKVVHHKGGNALALGIIFDFSLAGQHGGFIRGQGRGGFRGSLGLAAGGVGFRRNGRDLIIGFAAGNQDRTSCHNGQSAKDITFHRLGPLFCSYSWMDKILPGPKLRAAYRFIVLVL